MARKKLATSQLEEREYYKRKYEEGLKKPRPTTVYAEDTENAINRMKRIWKEYSQVMEISPRKSLKQAEIGRLVNFLDWYCFKYTVRKVSSMVTYWRTLSQLYIMWKKGRRLGPLILKQVEAYIYGELAEEYDLDASETEKPLLDARDMFQVLYCLWVTFSHIFRYEVVRIQLAAIVLLAAYTGSRPAALLAITYRDIELFVQRDRDDPRRTALMMTLTLRSTKSREKQARVKTYTFNLDKNPFLCIITHIIMNAFHDDAFDSLPGGPRLTPKNIFELGVRDGLFSQSIPFRKEIRDRPIFCDPALLAEGSVVALSYNQYHPLLKRLGVETGFFQILTTYCLRRATANEVNDDPNSNEPVRNLIMDHTNSQIFCRNYLSRMIRYDTMATFLGAQPHTDWIRNAHSMSRSIDPRRPKELTTEQKAAIRKEPEIQQLARWKEKLSRRKQGRHRSYKSNTKRQDAQKAYTAAIRKRERDALVQIRREYEAIAPLQDLRAQLEGDNEAIGVTEQPLSYLDSPFSERHRLAEAFSDLQSCRENENTHRLAVLQNMIALCSRQNLETTRRPRRQQQQQQQQQRQRQPLADVPNAVTVQAVVKQEQSKEQLAVQVVVKQEESEEQLGEAEVWSGSDEQAPPIICKPYQCLECIGKSFLSADDRFKMFKTKDSLRRHYDRQHTFVSDQLCPHPACKQGPLTTRTHYMNHTAMVHKIMMSSRTCWKAIEG